MTPYSSATAATRARAIGHQVRALLTPTRYRIPTTLFLSESGDRIGSGRLSCRQQARGDRGEGEDRSDQQQPAPGMVSGRFIWSALRASQAKGMPSTVPAMAPM